MAFSAEYIYRILDQYSGPLQRITKQTDKFRAVARQTAERIGGMSDRLAGMGGRMANVMTAIGGIVATGGIAKLAQQSMDMSDAMADVARGANLSGDSLTKMQEQLQKLGRETGRNALGLAAMAYEGGKLDTAAEDLVPFVKMVMKTAVAFDMADEEAGRSIGSIKSKLGLPLPYIDALLQRVNYLADNTSASGAQMIEIIERTSGTFSTLKIPPELTAGWAAFANQVEVSPELAASGLNMMMAKMMTMPGMLKKMLDDPKNAVRNFLKTFEKMPEAERGAKILKIFGSEAGRFVLKAVANTKLLDEAMAKAADSKALGSMDREFSNIMARSSTAVARIKQTLLDISRAIGSVFVAAFDKYSGRIQAATEYVLTFIKTHPGLVKLAGGFALILAGVSMLAVPLGIIFSVIGAGLPILGMLTAAIGSISAPVIAAVVGIAALIAMVTTAYQDSGRFQQSITRLFNAFGPLIEAIKMVANAIGTLLAGALGTSGGSMQAWGDLFSVAVNLVAFSLEVIFNSLRAIAGFIIGVFSGNWKAAFDSIMTLFDPLFALFDMLKEKLNIFGAIKSGLGSVTEMAGGAWNSMKDFVGLGPANDKAQSRATDNKMEVSGQIDVRASGGAKVERADIGVNTGNNLATAY